MAQRIGILLAIVAGSIIGMIAGTHSGSLAAASPRDIPEFRPGLHGAHVGDLCRNPRDGAVMVWVPPGDYRMGADSSEIKALLKYDKDWDAGMFADEQPRHDVYLDGFWIYQTEVTMAQFQEYARQLKLTTPDAPAWMKPSEDFQRHPRVAVSWQQAMEYARWAGGSLPTEAQWEKSARGTDGRFFPWGNTWPPPAGAGNFADQSARSEVLRITTLSDYSDGFAKTAPVGSFPAGASPYHVYDMSGNVWEWCADRYAADYYAHSPRNNPAGPEEGNARVIRGGGWDTAAGVLARCAARGFHQVPDTIIEEAIGFRCVVLPDGEEEK